MGTDPLWERAMQHSEALCRTIVDMILFDRVKLANESAKASGNYNLNNLRIIGEHSVSVPAVNPSNLVITGKLDWALGYGENNRFEIGPLRQAFLTWISEFLTGRLSMSVSLLRPKLALNPETSKKE
jgi:hypothetical protein